MVDVSQISNATADGDLLVIDLGKHSRKKVKQLRRGTGKLVDEVRNCVKELRAAGTMPASAVPVVILVREKRKGVAGILGLP